MFIIQKFQSILRVETFKMLLILTYSRLAEHLTFLNLLSELICWATCMMEIL